MSAQANRTRNARRARERRQARAGESSPADPPRSRIFGGDHCFIDGEEWIAMPVPVRLVMVVYAAIGPHLYPTGERRPPGVFTDAQREEIAATRVPTRIPILAHRETCEDLECERCKPYRLP